MRLLVVEDVVELSQAIADGLGKNGFVADVCFDGQSALALALSQAYAVIILDRMLPKLDGITFCQVLRDKGSVTPVLMLTARDTIDDRVEGLNAGADDYLVKPFAFAELLARTRALSRRNAAQRSNVLKAGGVTLDLTTGQLFHGDSEIEISAKECMLLTALLRHPGRLLSHSQLLEQVWSTEDCPMTDVVRAHVKNLRKKLAQHGVSGLIETVHGMGYRVVV